MKKTYRKVILRTMKGTFSRFAAIAAIVALGVGLLSGLMAMPINMRITADNYYDRQNLHDLRIVSMLGLTEDDVKAIEAVDGIDEVMPAYMADVFMNAGEHQNIVTRVHSLPTSQIEEKEPQNYLNRLDVIEGRLPLRRGECVLVESNTNDSTGPLSVGSTLIASDANSDLSDTLADTEFKIVGIVRTSYYSTITQESATIGDGTVALKMYVGEESFSQPAYSEIYATVEGAKALSGETQLYRNTVDTVRERVEEISDARCVARYDEVKSEIEEQLADAHAELADARRDAEEQFADAEQQMQDAENQLDQAEKELSSAKNKIASGEKELKDNKQALPNTLSQKTQELAAGKAALAEGKQKLEDSEKLIAEKRQQLADAKAQITQAKQLIAVLEPNLVQAEQQLAYWEGHLPPLQEDAAKAQQLYDKAAQTAQLEQKKAAAAAAQQKRDFSQQQLDTAQAALDAAQNALSAAQATVAEGIAAAGCTSEEEWLLAAPEAASAAISARDTALADQANAQMQRDTAQQQLDQADAELTTAKAAQAAAEAAVLPVKAALDTANAKLTAAQTAYDTANTALTSIRTQLDQTKAMVAAGEPQLAEGEKQLAEGEKQLEAGKKQLMEAEKALISGESALDLAPTLAQLQLQLAEEQLNDAKVQFEDGEKQLDDGRSELEKNRAEYLNQKADAEQQLQDAEQQILDGERQLADLEVPKWMVMDRSYHNSSSSFFANVDKLEAITTVFPVFFFLVAALVALTTMTRMVDDERLQIGTLKALGYHSSQIMFKYLSYAWLATLVGGALGLAFGFTVIPIVIWNAYATMYTIPGFHCLFHGTIALISVGAALLCTSIATWDACWRTLREWTARLLLPKAPAAGKRILLEHITPIWKRMSFTHKVTARNLFRYKKRFFMTVVGVAGCTALLVTGFGLKDSIGDIVSKQFGEIFTYDFMLTLSSEKALSSDEFKAVMDDPQQVESYLPVHQERLNMKYGEDRYNMYLFVPEEPSRMPNFIDLHERKSRETVPLTDDGVVITEKFSSRTGLKEGDQITLTNEEGHTGEFTITGIAENYVENYTYITPEVYRRTFGDEPSANSIVAFLPGDTHSISEELSSSLLSISNVAGITELASLRKSLDDTLRSINYVVYVIILCAGMLAFVVLYNLMNINIAERSKEIATIKVLGFYQNEVQNYIYRESNILSLIGMVVGLGGGILLHRFIMTTVEVDMVMFGQDIKPLSFLLSAVLTVLFSQFVNLVMRRKLRNISMVESMKAPE